MGKCIKKSLTRSEAIDVNTRVGGKVTKVSGPGGSYATWGGNVPVVASSVRARSARRAAGEKRKVNS